MTIKQVFKLNIDYSSSPYFFYTDGTYSINGNDYYGDFIYTNLTDYPQLDHLAAMNPQKQHNNPTTFL